MKQRNKPVVGQTLYVVERDFREGQIKLGQEVKVSKVGRKYFYLDWGWCQIPFDLKNWRQKIECTPDYIVYESEQEYLDEVERNKLLSKIEHQLRYRSTKHYTLEQVRKIVEIMKISLEGDDKQ